MAVIPEPAARAGQGEVVVIASHPLFAEAMERRFSRTQGVPGREGVVKMANERVRFGPDGVPLGKEEGDPKEHLADDPGFETRFQARLVELGRQFGLHRGARAGAPLPGDQAPEPRAARRRR